MVVGDEAVIAFQGTDDFGDWFTNLDNDLAAPPSDRVHRGFLKTYRSVSEQIRAVPADHESSTSGSWGTASAASIAPGGCGHFLA